MNCFHDSVFILLFLEVSLYSRLKSCSLRAHGPPDFQKIRMTAMLRWVEGGLPLFLTLEPVLLLVLVASSGPSCSHMSLWHLKEPRCLFLVGPDPLQG